MPRAKTTAAKTIAARATTSELTMTQVKNAIRKCLSPDLLSAEWRAQVDPAANKVAGHCTVASEAFFYFVGGRKAGYSPAVCTYYKSPRGKLTYKGLSDAAIKRGKWQRQTHWWVQGPKGTQKGAGRVHDLTSAQFDFDFPYENGRRWPFQQPRGGPTLRAEELINRVEKLLGKDALDTFRNAQITRWEERQAKAENAYSGRPATRQPISRRQKPSGHSI